MRVWRGEPSLGRDIGENAAIVVVEVVSMDAADEDIFPAVVPERPAFAVTSLKWPLLSFSKRRLEYFGEVFSSMVAAGNSSGLIVVMTMGRW